MIPPLAGLFSYEEAARPGYPVAGSAQRLWRLAYAHRRLPALAQACDELARRSEQADWWPDFLAAMRAGRQSPSSAARM